METTFVFIYSLRFETPRPIRRLDLLSTPFDTPMSNTETLDQIPKGRSVYVVAVVGGDPIAQRLGDLGIRRGVRIEVIRRAPLGDPTVFEFCGYQLCLRRTESARVQVSSAAAEDASMSLPRPNAQRDEA